MPPNSRLPPGPLPNAKHHPAQPQRPLCTVHQEDSRLSSVCTRLHHYGEALLPQAALAFFGLDPPLCLISLARLRSPARKSRCRVRLWHRSLCAGVPFSMAPMKSFQMRTYMRDICGKCTFVAPAGGTCVGAYTSDIQHEPAFILQRDVASNQYVPSSRGPCILRGDTRKSNGLQKHKHAMQ